MIWELEFSINFIDDVKSKIKPPYECLVGILLGEPYGAYCRMVPKILSKWGQKKVKLWKI